MTSRPVLLTLLALGLVAFAPGGCGSARTIGGPPLPHEADRMGAQEAVELVVRALAEVPEVNALRARIAERGARFVILREGDADPSEDSPRVWQVFVGEAQDTHLSRRWSFNVDAVNGHLSVTDPETLEEVPFERWREQLRDDPELRLPSEPADQRGAVESARAG